MNIRIEHTAHRMAELMLRAPQIIMREVDRASQRTAIEGVRIGKRLAPKNLSTLVNSIHNRRVGLAFHEVVFGVDYASYADRGRRPGRMPPIDAIRRWIRAARIRPRAASTERGLAFLIARKIGREGTPGANFVRPTEEGTRARFEVLLQAAVQRGVEAALA